MSKKLYFRFSIFLVIVLGLAVFLINCGGKGKEEKPEMPAESVETTSMKATTTQPDKPLPAAESTDDMNFESDKLDDQEETLNGVLNWSKGFIRAKGYGVPPPDAISVEQGRLMAFRAAYADALANLLETTNGVKVTATTTVKDYVVKDNTIELKVSGVIKGSKEVKRVFDEEKNIAIAEVGIAMEDVAMSIPKKDELSFDDSIGLEVWETKKDATLRSIAGKDPKLAEIIEKSKGLGDIEQKLQKMSEENESLASTNKELADKIQLLTMEISKLQSSEKPQTYTGVVVNAAGSGIKPVMAPNIYYKSGDTYKLLYGIDDGRERDSNMHALVVWERTLTGASDNTRVTRTPLIVNATYLAKEQAALAVSEEDAKIINKANKGSNLLEDGRVVVVR